MVAEVVEVMRLGVAVAVGWGKGSSGVVAEVAEVRPEEEGEEGLLLV